jgi:hypothetical protein
MMSKFRTSRCQKGTHDNTLFDTGLCQREEAQSVIELTKHIKQRIL